MEPVSARQFPSSLAQGLLHTERLSEGLEKERRKPGPAMKPQRTWDRDWQAARTSPPLQTPKSPTSNP